MKIGDTLWHSSRINDYNEEKPQYNEPTKIISKINYFTVMPATSRGYMEVMKYGEDVDNTWTAIANARAFNGKIKVGDLFWLDGEQPITALETEYGNGSTATAIVKSVAYGNQYISITLTRNKEQITQ